MSNKIKQAALKLKQCNKLVIGAGAGMSKDSGMPDFRGNQGFWNNYPPYRGKFNFYQCASPDFLHQSPHLFWGFYGSRLTMYRNTPPHKGFNQLSKISQKMQDHFIVTSNVDGHFQQIFSPQKVNQVHGSIHHLQCYFCDLIYENDFIPDINYEEMSCRNLPLCPKCNRIVRPNILMFNDWQWLGERAEQQEKSYKQFLKNICDDDKLAIIEIGSGTAVPTIRNMCQRIYYQYKNSIFIRINTQQDFASAYKNSQRFYYLQNSALKAILNISAIYDQIR